MFTGLLVLVVHKLDLVILRRVHHLINDRFGVLGKIRDHKIRNCEELVPWNYV